MISRMLALPSFASGWLALCMKFSLGDGEGAEGGGGLSLLCEWVQLEKQACRIPANLCTACWKPKQHQLMPHPARLNIPWFWREQIGVPWFVQEPFLLPHLNRALGSLEEGSPLQSLQASPPRGGAARFLPSSCNFEVTAQGMDSFLKRLFSFKVHSVHFFVSICLMQGEPWILIEILPVRTTVFQLSWNFAETLEVLEIWRPEVLDPWPTKGSR